MGQERNNQAVNTGVIIAIAVGVGVVMFGLLGCAGALLVWGYSAVEIEQGTVAPQPAPPVEINLPSAQNEKEHPDESIPGIVDNIDRRLDQFDELGAPVDREKNEKLKAILGDLTGSETE